MLNLVNEDVVMILQWNETWGCHKTSCLKCVAIEMIDDGMLVVTWNGRRNNDFLFQRSEPISMSWMGS